MDVMNVNMPLMSFCQLSPGIKQKSHILQFIKILENIYLFKIPGVYCDGMINSE